MEGFWDYVKDSGLPPYIVLAIIVFYIIANKTRLFERSATKTERELLSMDQKDFRQAMMDDMKTLRRELREANEGRDECEDRYAAACHKINEIIEAIQGSGLDLAMALAKIRPTPDITKDGSAE